MEKQKILLFKKEKKFTFIPKMFVGRDIFNAIKIGGGLYYDRDFLEEMKGISFRYSFEICEVISRGEKILRKTW